MERLREEKTRIVTSETLSSLSVCSFIIVYVPLHLWPFSPDHLIIPVPLSRLSFSSWMSSFFFFSIYSSTSPSTVITLGFFHLAPIVCLLPHPVTSSASGPSLIPVDRRPPFHTYSTPPTHTLLPSSL